MVKKLVVALLVVSLALGGVAVAAYYGLISIPWFAKSPEHSARYYPTDTLAYTWLTLYPSAGQRREAEEIWSRLDERRAFRHLVKDVEDFVEDETEFDIEDDILTWIGAEISAAVMDFDVDDGEADAAITIDVRDSEAAADFLSDWRDYLEDTYGADYDKDTINDYDVWLDENSDFVHALTPDLMIFATNEGTLEEVLDRVSGKNSRTLASSEQFIDARAALPGRRFTSGYVDYRGLTDALDSGMGRGLLDLNALEDSCSEALAGAPDWVMTSGAWVDRGLVVDFVSPTVNTLWPPSPNVADAAGALPEDSLWFVSLGFDPNLDNWRDPLRDCLFADLVPDWDEVFKEVDEGIIGIVESFSLLNNPDLVPMPKLDQSSTLADALDLGLWTTDQLIGVHPEEDFLDYLAGDLILAVHDINVDFDSLQPSDPNTAAVDGVAVMSYRPGEEDALRATVDGLMQRLVTKPPDEVDVGAGEPARIYPLREFDSEGYGLSPGYVFHDGYLTIGTTEKALADTVALQNGEGQPLSSDVEYQRAVGHLPKERQMLMYVDISLITDRLDLEDRIEDNDLYDVLIYSVNAMAMSTHTDDEFSRATLSLILFSGE